ncbi:hypothetical protein EV644_106138 [Kribbella orskensis]|uniref:SPW repeat-containing protein n=1 Tax=Kribbella orskensis TaxID=2512216 RepID=A0ABY2BM85_9ACTN|nr:MULTISPECIES: hypothetical protein [Kribbella]TCN40210.1 hypothetical protein EV642_105138 [Kribbella sp. VKM Ac-2500]TCO22830.1 hypothetical protein EV644_106138 [Kribbella orskensis]
MLALGLLSGQGYDALLGPAWTWTWTIVLVIDGFGSFSYGGHVEEDVDEDEPGKVEQNV